MAKRGAERDMDRDNWADQDDTVEDPGEFKKADATTLQQRVIKAPKGRLAKLAQGTSPSINALPMAQPVTPSQDGAAKAGFTFGASNTPGAMAGKPSFTFGATSTPTPAPFGFGNTTTPSKPPTFSLEKENQSEKVEEFVKNLAGLNASLVKFVQQTISSDRIANLSPCLASYESQRKSIMEKYKDVVKSLETPNGTSSGPTFSIPQLKPVEKPVDKPVEDTPIKDASPEPKPTFGFGPKETPKPSFSFGVSQSSETPKPTFAFGSITDKPETPKPSFSFGANTSTNKVEPPKFGFGSTDAPKFGSSDKPETPKPTFSFGSSTEKETPKPTFSFGAATEKPVEKPSFGFGASETPKPTFAFGSSTEKPETPKPSFSFGAAASGTTDKPTFSFGAPKESEPTKPTFSFGASKESEPAKPMFSFGAAAAAEKSDKPSFSFGGSSGSAPFSFNPSAPVFSTTPAPIGGDDEEEGDEEEAPSEPPTDPSKYLRGQGEEDETTEYECKAVIQAFDVEKKAYEKKGVGLLKCNIDSNTGKGRILVRVEGTGKVLLNQRITPTTNFDKPDKSHISFIGVNDDGTKPVKYLIKTKPEDQTPLFTAFEKAKK